MDEKRRVVRVSQRESKKDDDPGLYIPEVLRDGGKVDVAWSFPLFYFILSYFREM